MNLFILRHGLAVDPGTPGYPDDSQRPLTPKGVRRLQQITEVMRRMELAFDVIFSSPYLRAAQTADIVADAFDLQKKLVLTNELAPGGSPKALIEQVNKLKPAPPNGVMLVGHEPYLSQLIALLVTGGTTAAIELKKAGLARLETEALSCGRCATLSWLLTPRQMESMT